MKTIYTCITGGYDILKEPAVLTPGWRYVCFTDNVFLSSKNWEIIQLPKSDLDPIRLARRVKLLVHEYLPHAELTIWHDARIEVNCNLDQFVSKYHHADLTVMKHPDRDCVYEEARSCIRRLKDRQEVINLQLKRYFDQGYPEHAGMVATGIMIRGKGAPLRRFLWLWWFELVKGSYRDQLSFNYIYDTRGIDMGVTYRANIPFSVTQHEFKLSKHAIPK